MEPAELLLQERSRLARTSVTVAILCLLLAAWARQPLLQIELPLAGAKIENLTAMHAVVLGLPLVTFLNVWVAGQILRVTSLAAALRDESELALTGSRLNWDLRPRVLVKLVGGTAIVARYLVIVLIPLVASQILFNSFFDFRICDPSKPNCIHADEVPKSKFFFSSLLWEIKPSYMSLNDESSGDAKIAGQDSKTINETRATIRQQIPYIYAPLQTWIYLLLQSLNVACFIVGSFAFFQRSPTAPKSFTSVS